MEWLLDHEVIPFLEARLGSSMSLQARVVHVAGVGESWVDDLIQDLETQAHPTVGVLAHPGRIDIRIAAKASSPYEAWAAISPVEAEVRRRLGPAVFGVDRETLEGGDPGQPPFPRLEAGHRRGRDRRRPSAAILAEAGDGWAGGLVLAEPSNRPVGRTTSA